MPVCEIICANECVLGGASPQSIQSCLEVLDYFLKQHNTLVSSMVVAGKQTVNKNTTTIADTVANILGKNCFLILSEIVP